jgi:hypothetical protein
MTSKKWVLPVVLGWFVSASGNCLADTPVAQSGPDPIVISQTETRDNLVVLMAAASEHNSGLSLIYSGAAVYPKHFWYSNWDDNSNDYMKWNVSLETGGDYHVYAKLSASDTIPLRLSIEGSFSSLPFSTRTIGWDRLDAGIITLPAGTRKLALRRDTDATGNLEILSLELIREADRPAYEQRVAAFRSDTTWLSQSNYGLMFQMGPWGYPATGPKKSLENFSADFDVPKFVSMVRATGANYVIWSMSWWTYQICAPIQAVDAILGNGDRTSTRDLIGEIAAALHHDGIRFMLYYHTGHDSHLAYNSTDWWQAQQFPAEEFTERGTGDRSVFFNNWIAVITEAGNRYGTQLDGWFFDDAMVYYPAPFERLGEAAKAGNPSRLVCYNPWIIVRNTDFQDVWMGEGNHGESQFGSTASGGNGIFTDGPMKGLLQQAMFTMEQDWGVYSQNQAINTSITSSQAIHWVKSASARGVPLSINLMMWEDQTCSQSSLDILTALKTAIYNPLSNLIVNGDFEDPQTAYYDRYITGDSTLTGWQVDALPPDGAQIGCPGSFGPNNGSQNLQLTGGSDYSTGGSISQTISTVAGENYQVSVDLASRDGSVAAGEIVFGESHRSLSAGSGAFITATWQLPATGSSTTLTLIGEADSATRQLLLDNVTVSVVPMSYTLWQDQNFTDPAELADPTVSGPLATPAGDGVSNLLKYAMGLSARVHSANSLTTVVPSGESLALRYQRPSNRPDLSYSVETSPDLAAGTWNTDNVSLIHLSTTAGIETWQASSLGLQPLALFFRLRVIQN